MKKDGYESSNESEASNKTTIPKLKKPKVKGLRKKVDESLLTKEQMEKRKRTKIKRAHQYMEKGMKNLSIS